MTYYDELGLNPTASPDEIHRAFRRLTKLLHPDRQQEEATKALAEAQMRRAIHVFKVLSDPLQRSAYDASLSTQTDRIDVGVALSDAQSPLVTSAILAGIFMGCLLTYCAGRALQTPPRELMVTRSANSFASPQSVSKTQVPPKIVRESKVAAQRVPSGVAVQQEHSHNEASSIQASVPTAPVPIVPQSSEPPTDDVLSSVPGSLPILRSENLTKPRPLLSGIWLHSKDPKDKPAAWQYSAEYVELRLSEQFGEVVGTYRSRYRISDRALKPEIAFRFRGPVDATEFPWEQSGGARGVIRLQLQGEHQMEASWRVLQGSATSGLTAGSATLIKRNTED